MSNPWNGTGPTVEQAGGDTALKWDGYVWAPIEFDLSRNCWVWDNWMRVVDNRPWLPMPPPPDSAIEKRKETTQ